MLHSGIHVFPSGNLDFRMETDHPGGRITIRAALNKLLTYDNNMVKKFNL
jgi:hypothetical protein